MAYRLTLGGMGLALLGLVSGLAAQPLAEEQAVQTLFNELITALNEQDVEGVVATLADEVQVTVSLGQTPETITGKETFRQLLAANPPWAGQEFRLAWTPAKAKIGVLGNTALAVVDLAVQVGWETLRPRFLLRAAKAEGPWKITAITEVDNSPQPRPPAPTAAPKAELFVVVSFDLAQGVTEQEFNDWALKTGLPTWLKREGIVSIQLYQSTPLFTEGLDTLGGYLMRIGVRDLNALEALGYDAEIQESRRAFEDLATNIRIGFFSQREEFTSPPAAEAEE